MKRTGFLTLLLVLAGCNLFPPPGGSGPRVNSVTPADNATNVSVGARVIATLNLPNGAVNVTSANENTVRLTNADTGQAVSADVSVNNDTETLTLEPLTQLEFGTPYRFEVTSSVTDEEGGAFAGHSSAFTTVSSDAPSVIKSGPADGEVGVPVDTNVAAEISTDGGVAPNSITEASVYLSEASGARVPGGLGTSGGGDIVTFNPEGPLKVNTRYQFNVTSAVTDRSGAAFIPYTATFTTGSDTGLPLPTDVVTIAQPTAARKRHTSLAVDPGGSYLYASTGDGEIRRYPVGGDGTLGAPETLTRLAEADGTQRIIVGLTFDPASTAQNPIVWATHSSLSQGFDGDIEPGITAFWSGKLTRLSGPTLQTVQDYVVGLPRSNKDHLTNSVAFNSREPGVLYFTQGSNTAMGAPDKTWGYQPERVLSGAVLRLDTNSYSSWPLNAQTEDGGTYDPYAPGAPLTVYATGTHNSYDLVWHSSGNLYVPANGSNRGGNVPRYNPLPGTCENRPEGGYSGPVLDSPSDVNGVYTATGTDDLGQTVSVEGWRIDTILNDYLFKIKKGGYYGTPNPKRCEWILNGGGVGLSEYPNTKIAQYAASVEPDPNYLGPAGDFGRNISPNGALEYRGTAFPGLRGKLLVVRYSGYDDVVAVTLGTDGDATAISPIIATPAGLEDPLDITESPTTGNLYVSWFNERGGSGAPEAGITLLRPQ